MESDLFLGAVVVILGKQIATVGEILGDSRAEIGSSGCCETESRKRTQSELQGFFVCAGSELGTEGSTALLISISASQGCSSRSCPLEQGLAHR